MILELPKGYKYVVQLDATSDMGTNACHIVADDRVKPEGGTLPGRLTETLCRLQVDTRRPENVPEGGMTLPPWGTQANRPKSRGDGLLYWPGVCGRCVRSLAFMMVPQPGPNGPEETSAQTVERAWNSRGEWIAPNP